MKPHLAEVATLYETNCRSIPDMLRMAAEGIENEQNEPDCSPTVAIIAVQLARNGEVNVYGWGDTNDLHALGVLERGKHDLLNAMSGDDE